VTWYREGQIDGVRSANRVSEASSAKTAAIRGRCAIVSRYSVVPAVEPHSGIVFDPDQTDGLYRIEQPAVINTVHFLLFEYHPVTDEIVRRYKLVIQAAGRIIRSGMPIKARPTM
jgi:hypothetical protein